MTVPHTSLFVALLAIWAGLKSSTSAAWAPGSSGAASDLRLAVWTNPIYFIGGVGALLLVIAESHAAGSRFAIPYRYYGSLLVGGALVPLSFFDLHNFVGGHDLRMIGPSTLLSVAAVIVVLLTGPATAPGTGPRTIPSRQRIPLGLSLLMTVLPLLGVLTRAALVPTVLANLAMVAGAFWLMQVGLQEDRGRPFSAVSCTSSSGRYSATSICSATSAEWPARRSCSSPAERPSSLWAVTGRAGRRFVMPDAPA